VTTVLVVDDSELIRVGLVTVLESDPDLKVVAQGASGPEAVGLAAEHQPDVVLMDVEMPGGGGLEATREIVESSPLTRVLILTMFDLDDYVVEALRAGAAGFVLKTTGPADLIHAVKACAAGETVVGPSVMARLVDSYVHRPPTAQVRGFDELTDRERDVLRAMSKGLSNAEIGKELYVAEATVKTHVARILAKLGVRDRVQAVVRAYQSGLVSQED
jgi:DNA-binding NarL/FixJ family response regulator